MAGPGADRRVQAAQALSHGDFYPLTPHSVQDDVWMAYQFHREDLGQGMVLAFRRPESGQRTEVLKLGGVRPGTRYELTFEDSGQVHVLDGEELKSGLEVEIAKAPGSALITYRWPVS